jgi:putative membrane protein
MTIDASHPGHRPDSTDLAYTRTYLASERTLMAWVRTATSLISFGFTIYKFFQFEAGKSMTGRADFLLGPQAFATLMIGIGIIALAMATTHHLRRAHRARSQGIEVPFSPAAVVAGLVSGLGLLSLGLVVFDV